jgi:hypothetical protein
MAAPERPMFNLFDVLRDAQGGEAIDNLARQFNLTPEQTQRAIDALLPAFALSLQRNAANPYRFAELLGMMGSGRYANFFDLPGQAFTPQGRKDGSDILARLFGNKEVSRHVASLTAAMTGISTEVVKQMLPPLAAMLIGGLFRSASSQGLGAPFARFAEMFREGVQPQATPGAWGAAAPGAAANPFSPWAEMMTQLWGRDQRADKAAAREPPQGSAPNPFGPWVEMMNSMLRAMQPAPEPPPKAPEPPPGAERDNPFAVFAEMFDAGRKVQEQHLAQMRNIFDTYWRPERDKG